MSHLRGNLQSIALPDVLQLLHVNRKTGKLFLSHEKKKAILFVRNGEVIHAELGPIGGERAAFEILQWEKGFFEFATPAYTSPVTIRRTLNDLLMEGARTTDTRKRFRSVFPDLGAVPCPTLQGPALVEGLKLFPEDRKIIPYLDGYRSFREIIEHSGEVDITVFQACMILKEAGRLEVIEPERELTVVPLRLPLFRKASHVEISLGIGEAWRALGPHRNRPIQRVRLAWAEGAAVAPVRFECLDGDKTVAVPKDLMQAWGISEGSPVKICPAP